MNQETATRESGACQMGQETGRKHKMTVMGTEKVMDDDNVLNGMGEFRKSNMLISSKYKTGMFTNKVLMLGLYHLQKGEFEKSKSGNLVCTLTAAEVKEKLGVSGTNAYRNLNMMAKEMIHFTLGMSDDKSKKFCYINLFTDIHYQDGKCSIIFNGDLRNYLTELKKNYTMLNLPLMLKMKRVYSFRLFELLSSRSYLFRDNGYKCEYEIGLAELKFTIGCYDVNESAVAKILEGKDEPDYEEAEKKITVKVDSDGNVIKNQCLTWNAFSRFALFPAVREINETPEADMEIEKVEPIRVGKGGKIRRLRFIYRTHLNDPIVQDAPQEAPNPTVVGYKNNAGMTEDERFDMECNVRNAFRKHGFSITDVRAVCQAADYDEYRIEVTRDRLESYGDGVRNPVGWVIDRLRNWEAYEGEV